MHEVILIVGLGNPGDKYANTKHNVGFMTIDAISNRLGVSLNKNNFSGKYGFFFHGEKKIILAKPLTFMNLSGEFVKKISDFYKISISNIIVIYDDFNFKLGTFKLKPKGSSAGHNGMKNIIQCLGSENIKRIRIGIDNGNVDKINKVFFVLSEFNTNEFTILSNVINDVVDAVKSCIDCGFENTMQKINSL